MIINKIIIIYVYIRIYKIHNSHLLSLLEINKSREVFR